MNQLLWRGDHWLGVGSHLGRAAAWTSADGLAWSPVPDIDPAPSDDPQDMRGYSMSLVAEVGGELLALGWNRIGCCDGGRPAMWRSSDGISWQFEDLAGTPFGDTYHFPSDLRVAPDGSLILLSGAQLGNESMMWISQDGRTWSRLENAARDRQPLLGLAVGSDLMMVVGASEWLTDDAGEVWTSSDGHTWTARQPPPDASLITDVAYDAARDQFVMGGIDVDERPMVWLTRDGVTYATTRLADDRGWFGQLVADGGLIVASGSVGLTDSEAGQSTIWSSYDGVTWAVHELGRRAVSASVLGVANDVVMATVDSDDLDGTIVRGWHADRP